MGAGGLGLLAFLFVAVVVIVLLTIIGISLMVIGARQKSRDGSTGVLWTGSAIIGLIGALIIGFAAWKAISSDPTTVGLDLRGPITTASLHKDPDPGFGGTYYSYDSDHVEVTLPDGSAFRTDVNRVSLFAKDGVVTRIRVEGEQALWRDAATTVHDWAKDLHTEVTPPASSQDKWEQKVDIDGIEVDFELWPLKRDTGLDVPGQDVGSSAPT